jgi:general secretion pathway protein E
VRYPLPYAFARTSQLLLEDDGTDLTAVARPDDARTEASAWGEIMRRYEVRSCSPRQLDSHPALAQRISAAAYSQAVRSSAATVVSEVQTTPTCPA